MSFLGACWHQAEVERNRIMGKKACRNGSNNWKVTQHTRMQEIMHKENDSWRKNKTRAWEEYLTLVGLGFW
jgi:formylmethanofuran dehydrogenase subunit B